MSIRQTQPQAVSVVLETMRSRAGSQMVALSGAGLGQIKASFRGHPRPRLP